LRATSHSASDTISVCFSSSFILFSFGLVGLFLLTKFTQGECSHSSA
jgi:hypothetical protein